MSLRDVVSAELIKLRTLPAVRITLAVTILAMAGFAAAGTGLRAVDYGQLGFIAFGVLAAASEYSSGQIRTSLTSVPHRTVLLAGKVLAYLVVAIPASLLAVTGFSGIRVLGATVYLTLIGLLSLATAVILRGLVGTITLMTTLVLVVSPLLAPVVSLAKYLPDQAGTQLYQPIDLSALHSGTILTGWILAMLTVAAVTFTRRDA